MRVLSPRMLPPERALEGSTASTATRLPSPIRCSPSASTNVLLPTPGTPLTPTRNAAPVCGRRISSRRCAASWWSRRVLSTRVIALASARRLPARTSAASASTGTSRLGADRGIRRGPLALADELQHAAGSLRDRRPGSEDRLHAGLLEERVVAGRDDAAHRDDDVPRARSLELAHELGHERLVAARLGGDAHHVDVVLHRLARDLLGGLEERADVDVEAEVGKRGGDHLGAAVVAVLADLGDQDARPPPVLDGELLDVLAEGRPFLVAGELAAVDARDGADLRPVPAPHLLERLRGPGHRGARPGRVDRQLEQVPVSRLGPSGERLERGPHPRR